MAATDWTDQRREDCEECDRQTPHVVRIEMRTESEKQENAAFSREPYRVTECRVCGAETTRRMNNA
ncbi:DUF7835 family putative zinc beta-ribbon protein [Halorussus halobius]|uniref:DUF7835 family putative zinc beta-ribbon protein n=1 Tax=Halorussus halobius TaxID=1710537 RepID=UPI001091EE14|nr:hypothetical protein [Halorussus halobius]